MLYSNRLSSLAHCIFLYIVDGNQIHQRAPARHQGRSEANLQRNISGLPGHFQHASVEVHAVRCRFPAHRGAGKAKVWSIGLEYSVRVQRCGLQRQRAVRAESPGRYGHQKGKWRGCFFLGQGLHYMSCHIDVLISA